MGKRERKTEGGEEGKNSEGQKEEGACHQHCLTHSYLSLMQSQFSKTEIVTETRKCNNIVGKVSIFKIISEI